MGCVLKMVRFTNSFISNSFNSLLNILLEIPSTSFKISENRLFLSRQMQRIGHIRLLRFMVLQKRL